MSSRLKNPAAILPESAAAIQKLVHEIQGAGVPPETLGLVHLRASQINGCSFCTVSGVLGAKKAGESEERLAAVAAWREAPWFSESERAALGLAEAMTRLSDRGDAVTDELWADVETHFDERQRAALVLWIATTNLFNRVNTAIRQPAGAGWHG